MSRRPALALLAAALIAAAAPARADFGGVVRAVDARVGGHRVEIPLFGLVRHALWMLHPEGVHDVQFTTWEGGETIEGPELQRILEMRAGSGFQPVVRARSRGESTFIYARPAGELIEIMLVTHDREDTVVLRALLDGDLFARKIHDHRAMEHLASR
jgi:hypothetical protein